MYQYLWDEETGGLLLTTEQSKFSKEPRPVYASELAILGFDKYWSYPKDNSAPLMWAEANNYIYRGRLVARTKGGALYTAPELIILDEPEPEGKSLQLVNIDKMVEKNRAIMESFVQETIQKIYNTYIAYKNKVDLFYVAFSGGKDSIVTLDLVQRALPHNDFKVLFGNTDMEFPTTLALAKKIRQYCEREGVSFYEAKADFSAIQSWNRFGPPARKVRWCCTVHKTAPVINKLCEIYFSSIMHELRDDPTYRAVVDARIEVPEKSDTRDTEAIKRICTAYLKLLFPNVQHPKDISSHDINLFCLKPAIEMRSIIKIQLGILDPEEFGGKTVPELCVKDIDE